MVLRWSNGVLEIGYLPYSHTYGVAIAWGRRDILEGRTVAEGEMYFADYKVWHVIDVRRLVLWGLR